MNTLALKDGFLLAVLTGYLVFNYGFMLLRVPPVAGGGVPIGEIVLLTYLPLLRPGLLLPRLATTLSLTPLVLWWTHGGVAVIQGYLRHGMWAFRDATSLIESAYLLLGFSMAARESGRRRLLCWGFVPLVLGSVQALTFILRDDLSTVSPTITGGSGQEVALLTSRVTGPSLLLITATALFLGLFRRPRGGAGVFAGSALILFAVVAFQARTVYLQVVAAGILLFLLRRRALKGLAVAGLLLVLILAVIEFSGLELTGRLGAPINAQFMRQHFLAIAGVESEFTRGPASGVFLRLGWWYDLYSRWSADLPTMVFGLGYGFPLVEFGIQGGIAVREPHNSYVSLVARLGLLGLFAWVWVHVELLLSWRRAYDGCGRLGWHETRSRLLLALVALSMLWVHALGEDSFEKPFFAIPYYFVWGVVLRIRWLVDRASERTSSVEPAARGRPVPVGAGGS